MTVSSKLKTMGARWLTSETRLKLARKRTSMGRVLSRSPRVLHYFHRVDDPYSQLMVQILPDFLARFDVEFAPHVVERLPANMYPDPARYEALAILDSVRLARLYGFGFPGMAMVPDRLAVGMAARHLAALESSPAAFLEAAQELGTALWRQDIKAVRSIAGGAGLESEVIAENEALLARMGFYASGTIIYGGEIYPGLDRLDHLERRLNSEGVGDGRVQFDLTRHWRPMLAGKAEALVDQEFDFFFSLRSPYSYIALEKVSRMVAETGARVRLKPVLPMVTRGLPVPAVKRMYIIADAAREARAASIAFGAVDDPLGEPVYRGMAQGLAFQVQSGDKAVSREMGLPAISDAHAFYRHWMQSTWARGKTTRSGADMTAVLARAGLLRTRPQPLADHDWRAAAEAAQRDMLTAGSWGVPSFKVGNKVFWGQDRLWAVVDALLQKAQAQRQTASQAHQPAFASSAPPAGRSTQAAE